MNSVVINTQEIPLPSWGDAAVDFALNVLDEIKRDNWELSIMLCDDKTITEMNRQYRNKNEPTDVLSFNLGETIHDGKRTVYLPGDIVISLDSLKENSKYFQIPEDEELRRLIIHGILHLDGMDHSSSINTGAQAESSFDSSVEPMLKLQEDLLKKLKGKNIIDSHGVKI